MSKDTNEILGHADEADGIEEYDNPLPDWWLGMFWLSILWAFAYGIHYHFIAHRSQPAALAAEMAAADARWPAQTAATAEFVMSDEAVAAGETIFAQNCAVCHGANLEGGIGPTFLDDEWLHGGDPQSVVHTITAGVPDKGMLSWGPILGPEKINQVAAYVLSKNRQAVGQ